MTDSSYRADIDGLRAIAVLSVIFYHAHLAGFSGGFVGVDVFFVISGYLISGHLFRELSETGGINLLQFLVRRIRRLYPLLLTVLVATICVWCICFLGVKSETTQLIESARFSIFGAANFYFQTHTGGYFDTASDQLPLLHIWSLAVEEQFYLSWPIIFLISKCIHQRTERIDRSDLIVFCLRTVAVASVLSFLGSLVVMKHHLDSVAFYQTPFRAWEFGAGSLLALNQIANDAQTVFSSQRSADLAHASGLSLIVFSITYYASHNRFPGATALFPVVGTILILLAGSSGKSRLSKAFLSNRALVSVGLISYGWYLWHWPIFALLKIHSLGDPLSLSTRLIAIAASGVLALFSRSFIENPIRYSRHLRASRPLGLLAATVGMSLLFCLALALLPQLENRLANAKYPDLASKVALRSSAALACDDIESSSHSTLCYSSVKTPGQPKSHHIFVIGNSHAGALYPMVDGFGESHQVSTSLQMRNGIPVVDYPQGFFHNNDSETQEYRQYISRVVNDVRRTKETQEGRASAVLIDRWMEVASQHLIMVGRKPKYVERTHNHARTMEFLETGLRSFVQELKNSGIRKILIMLPYPEFRYFVLRCETISPDRCDLSRSEFENYRREVVGMIVKVASEFKDIETFDPATSACDQKFCPEVIEVNGISIPSVYDNQHPSVTMASFLSEENNNKLNWLITP